MLSSLPWKLLLVTMSAILILAPSSASGLSSSSVVPAAPKRIPITVLSGFLGSGKTTLLQNMLQNKEGLRIAVVVNDVASVNIDSKLVSREYGAETGSDAMVELQNGCACCSLSDELLTSVSELVTMGDLKGEDGGFHHIVVELSGVADPKQIRAKFQEAALMDMPLMERVGLDTMVSLVDSSMFKSYFESSMLTSRDATPELFYRDGVKPDEPEEKEEWMKDLPPLLLEAVTAGLRGASESDEGDPVAELLVSQTETADLIVLNKADLADGTDMKELQDIVSAINPRAKVLVTSFGKVPLTSVLGIAGGKGVAEAGVVDDHREFISAVDVIVDRKQATGTAKVEKSASAAAAANCLDPNCDDDSHQHSHAHEHASSATTVQESNDPACTDDSHDHEHSHSHGSPAPADVIECDDPGCSDTSHSHSHSHSNDEVCTDANCDDQSHSHSHSHSTSTDALGIGSFVYKARRPFHPRRLVTFLREMPIERGIPKIEGTSDGEFKISHATKQALKSTLRSKGFTWCADSFSSAMYWSHAGKSFELNCLGAWWATLPRNQWPEDASEYVLEDFDDPDHDDSTFEGRSVGDRRQEVVFIGKTFSDASRQSLICDALDECLLSDREWEEYKSLRLDEEKLRSKFANPIDAKMKSY